MGDFHRASLAVDGYQTEELKAFRWRAIGPHTVWDSLEFQLWTESIVELPWAKRTGMQWTADEFPERIKLFEDCFFGIIVVRSGIVYVGR